MRIYTLVLRPSGLNWSYTISFPGSPDCGWLRGKQGALLPHGYKCGCRQLAKCFIVSFRPSSAVGRRRKKVRDPRNKAIQAEPRLDQLGPGPHSNVQVYYKKAKHPKKRLQTSNKPTRNSRIIARDKFIKVICAQCVDLMSAASASPRGLLELKNLRVHGRFPESGATF
ncbi:uncharacterized protein LOC144581587 isoform X2 [Callithrix jacchus]